MMFSKLISMRNIMKKNKIPNSINSHFYIYLFLCYL